MKIFSGVFRMVGKLKRLYHLCDTYDEYFKILVVSSQLPNAEDVIDSHIRMLETKVKK